MSLESQALWQYRRPGGKLARQEGRVMALRDVKLDDKYDLGHGRVFVTGFQALVRLCLMQRERDRRNGLNTAGFITIYRGSPLAGLAGQFLRATPFLRRSEEHTSELQSHVNIVCRLLL